MFRSFIHLDPRLKDGGGCCGGIFIIANIFFDPNVELIRD